MAIITRLTRLFRADVHAVLDRIEEPDILLRQALREMEEEVAQGARQLKLQERERQQLQSRLASVAAAREGIAEQLDLSFAANNETLARSLLRRRLEGERLSKLLEQRAAALSAAISAREAQLETQRRDLEVLRQKAELLDVRGSVCGDGVTVGADDDAVTDADVELAWLREQQRRAS